MTEERITETRTPSGDTHTTHTVVTDNGHASSGGGAKWGLVILLAIAVIAGIVIFSQMSGAEVAKDNAVTEAANSVGDAAGQIGDAAQNAGDAVQDSVAN